MMSSFFCILISTQEHSSWYYYTKMSMQMRVLDKKEKKKGLLRNFSVEMRLGTPDVLLNHSRNFNRENRQIKYISSHSSTGLLSCSCELAGSQQSTKRDLQLHMRPEEQLGPISTADVRCHQVEVVLHK